MYQNQYDSVAIASDGTLIFAGSGASLYAVDSEGRERWQTNGLGRSGLYRTPAIASDDTIRAIASYRNGANIVFAFASDGTPLWAGGGSGRSDGHSPAVDAEGNAYFAASGWLSSHEYYALAANGSTNSLLPLMDCRLDGPVTIGQDGTLYVWGASTRGAGLHAIAGARSAPRTAWPMHRQNARQTGRVEWPRLRGLVHSTDRVEVEVFADPGWICAVQVSSNLVQWTSVTNFVAETNCTVFTEVPVPDTAQRFYRVISPTPQ